MCLRRALFAGNALPGTRVFPILASLALAAAASSEVVAAPRPVGQEISVAADGTVPAVAVLVDRTVVVWATNDEPRQVVARLFDATGLAVGGPIHVGSYREGPIGWGRVDVAAVGSSFLVAWNGPRSDRDGTAVFTRRFTYAGAPEGPAEQITGTGPRDRWEPDVVPFRAGGGYAIVWIGGADPASYSDVFARRFHADGRPNGSSFRVNQGTRREQIHARGEAMHDGTLLVVWESNEGEGDFGDIFLRRFALDGAPLDDDTRVNGDEWQFVWQRTPDVALLADGGFVVAWSGPGQDTVEDSDEAIVGRLFDSGARPRTGDLVLNEAADGNQLLPALAAVQTGGFVVLWQVDCGASCTGPEGDGSLGGVYGRVFDGDGNPAGGDFLVPVATAGPQLSPAIAAAPAPDGMVAVWHTDPQHDGSSGVAMRRLGSPCVAAENRMCLRGGRFRVSVLWQLADLSRLGPGVPVPRGDDWGTFWFFRPSNVELAVKVLDGRALNGHFWVFYASLTDVPFVLWVEDLETARFARYVNPAGTLASRGDTTALPAPSEPTAASAAVPSSPPAGSRPPAPAGGKRGAAAASGCTPSPTRACLQGGRFAVEIEWEDFFGNRGTAGRGDLTTDTAYFWFFRPGNPEIVVKVLDGRPVNGRFWVFFGSLTNVAFRLVVTDTETGRVATYDNPLHRFASVGDTAAFPR